MTSIKPVHLVFGALILVTAIPSVSNLGGLSQSVGEARKEADRIGDEMTQLHLSQQEAEQKAEIANSRYQNGCVPVVDRSRTSYVTLVKGRPVFDAKTSRPLPAGTFVCDGHGNTAVLADDDEDASTPAVAMGFAFTGDKAVIDARLQQYRGASYLIPEG